MSFTYPLSVPAPLPEALTIGRRAVVGGTPSPFSLHLQTQLHQGQRWELNAVYPPLTAAQAGEWEAFFLKLNGRQGTFLFGDDARPLAQGSAGSAPGTPAVKGAAQSGNALICDGAPFSAAAYLKSGDPVALGTGIAARLYKVLTDTASDGAGNFTVDIWPSLQVIPADNDPLTVAAAKGLFRLPENFSQWEVDTALRYGFALAAQSVI